MKLSILIWCITFLFKRCYKHCLGVDDRVFVIAMKGECSGSQILIFYSNLRPQCCENVYRLFPLNPLECRGWYKNKWWNRNYSSFASSILREFQYCVSPDLSSYYRTHLIPSVTCVIAVPLSLPYSSLTVSIPSLSGTISPTGAPPISLVVCINWRRRSRNYSSSVSFLTLRAIWRMSSCWHGEHGSYARLEYGTFDNFFPKPEGVSLLRELSDWF